MVGGGSFKFAFFLALAGLAWGNCGRSDTVAIIDSEKDAAQVRVDLIQQAQEEINLQYYVVTGDEFSLAALGLLAQAAETKKVRLLVDGSANTIPLAIQAYLIGKGVEIKVFHPMLLYHPTWITRRMHDKLLVVDGNKMVTGGRNVAEGYFALGNDVSYRDRDIYLQGEGALEARESFMQIWNSKEVRPAELWEYKPGPPVDCYGPGEAGGDSVGCRAKQAQIIQDLKDAPSLLLGALNSLEAKSFIRLNTGNNWSANQHEVASVRFFHDKVGAKTPKEGISQELYSLLSSAQEAIYIESPYLVPTEPLLQLIKELRSRPVPVKIRILTNSIDSSDSLLPYVSYLRSKQELLDLGVDIWEYKGPRYMHAKCFVIDDKTAVIGSFNLDPRSETLNTEAALAIDSFEIAYELHGLMDEDLLDSVENDPHGKLKGKTTYSKQGRSHGGVQYHLLRLLEYFIHNEI